MAAPVLLHLAHLVASNILKKCAADDKAMCAADDKAMTIYNVFIAVVTTSRTMPSYHISDQGIVRAHPGIQITMALFGSPS